MAARSTATRGSSGTGGGAPTPLAAQSLEQAVYDAVRDRILTGELKSGDPLVEAQLSEEFGISKTPVREALIRLKRDGLVDQPPFHMNRVATPTAEDVRQVCEVRRWIEGQLAAKAATAGDTELVDALRATIDDAEAALGAGDVQTWAAAIGAFTDVLVAAWDNRYGADLLERVGNVLVLIANVSQDAPNRRRKSIDEHRAIVAAIAAGDPGGAVEATRVHLESIERDSLAALAVRGG